MCRCVDFDVKYYVVHVGKMRQSESSENARKRPAGSPRFDRTLNPRYLIAHFFRDSV